MTWFEALILGLIQGLTEFLPVSSSGHLEIGHAILGTATEENLIFTVVLHVATVLSTLLVLWHEVAQLFKGTFTTTKWNAEKDYVAKILVSCIPVFIVGMFFKEEVENFFGNGLILVGICLLITSTLLFLSEYLTKQRMRKQTDGAEVGHEVTYKDAFIIGIAQAIAVLPGLSRSGSTISTGLLCGVKKSAMAQFSFLMVLIPILGEQFLDLLDVFTGEAVFGAGAGSLSLLIGFVSAFLSGLFACKAMVALVRRAKLSWFALYCLVAAVLIFIIA